MRLQIVIPTVCIAVVVLVGLAVMAWMAVSGLSAEEPIAASDPSVTLSTPAPLGRALTPITSDRVSTESSAQVETGVRSMRAERVAAMPTGGETVYTWRDGDRTERVVLQAGLTVQKTATNRPEDVVVFRGEATSIVQLQPRHGPDAQPVFRSESGGELMTLPGGVLLSLDPDWNTTQVEDFFRGHNIPEGRRSEIAFLPNGFLVETEPGFASLEFANTLAELPGVVISSPNWQMELEAR